MKTSTRPAGAVFGNLGQIMIKGFFQLVVVAVLIGLFGLIVYAYVGDLSPVEAQVNQPVTLNAD